jgi:Mu transposase-like protein
VRSSRSVSLRPDTESIDERVRQALADALPPLRKTPVRQAPKLDPAKPFIDAMLRADLEAPRKQRHTARRILARLIDEHGFVDLGYSTVQVYVARRRPEVLAEARLLHERACVPQTHKPGAEAEVDFCDLWVRLAGVLIRCFLFTLRLSFSGKAVHRVFATQAQEAFLEGHLHAFAVLGGIPSDKVRYDNLKPAVKRVLIGRERQESERWIRSHHGFDSFCCIAGPEGAHEKGGVEGEGGRFRRTHLVPVPEVETLAELNALIEAADEADDRRRIGSRTTTVGQDFEAERPFLRPLPAEPFEPGVALHPLVDRYARITVRQSHYSVPSSLIGRRVRVCLRASELIVFEGRHEVVRHERLMGKGQERLVLDHYLEVLIRKPGALPGATALVQARESGMFTAAHDAFWSAARKPHGDAAGTRALVEALLLHRHLPHADVVAGLRAAVSVGATTAEVVAIEARRAHEKRNAEGTLAPVPQPPLRAERVVSLTERRLINARDDLPADIRSLPTVDRYDELLTRPTSGTETGAP